MEELNKKLAEWAGFYTITEHYDCGYGDTIATSWVHKDCYDSNKPPDFINSLDACFKWLVPKLAGDYQLTFEWALGGIECSWTIEECCESIKRNCYHCNAETPALALCLAIAKLIDGEGDETKR